MGDSRFDLKLTFRIYGREFPWDCSLNWTADEGEIDERITQFFLDSRDEAYAKWRAELERRHEKQRAKEIEDGERAELKRLRQKYPD